MTNADVVDHETLIFPLPADAIDTGNRLQQIVCYNDLVEIHDLFYGRIKSGQQHVPDDQDPHVASDTFLLTTKGHLEALDAGFVRRFF